MATNNGINTPLITLGGTFTTSGAFTTTLTVSGNTSVTLPTSGTLVNSAVTTLSSLTSIGTIATGVWNGTKVGLLYGGTNADLSGTGGTSQVLKQTSVGGNVSVAQLAASDLSNSTTGSGNVVLATSPTITTPIIATIKGTNGFNVSTFADVASTTDYFSLTSGTNNSAIFGVTSSQTNASFSIYGKGTGGVNIGANGGATTVPMSLYSGTYKFFFNVPTWTADRSLYLPNADVTLVGGTLVPTTGTGASGTWGISISGNAATVTTNANLTGDTTSVGNATTTTKTNGVAFATSATTDTTNASNISSGSLAYARLASIPACCVHGSTQSVSTGTYTLMPFSSVVFDKLSNFTNTASNYKFTAPVAGIYSVNADLNVASTSGNNFSINIYKNGSVYKTINTNVTAIVGVQELQIDSLISCAANDYLQIYAFQDSGFSQTFTLGEFNVNFVSN